MSLGWGLRWQIWVLLLAERRLRAKLKWTKSLLTDSLWLYPWFELSLGLLQYWLALTMTSPDFWSHLGK